MIAQPRLPPFPGSRIPRGQASLMIPALLVAASAAMVLQSPDLPVRGGTPAAQMAPECGGSNRAPVLKWSGVPAGAKSFALIERDPDAPIPGGFYHWVVYDLPASAHSLGGNVPPGVAEGLGTTGKIGYSGPCPPAGPAHHYIFTLYALDIARLPGNTALTGPQVEAQVGGHVLARATLEATATRP
jgi:Raf kinase inhibitor-like YbhB/YbcL family protein